MSVESLQPQSIPN